MVMLLIGCSRPCQILLALWCIFGSSIGVVDAFVPSTSTARSMRYSCLPTTLERPHYHPTSSMSFQSPSITSKKGRIILPASLQTELVQIAQSLFAYSGHVPFWQALGWNAILFAALSKKLLKSLTPEGFAHSMALGTLLWMTLGWRGWTLCVLYLFAGNAVTKIRFAEKEKRGLAEKRGGRRGPENVWYVY